MSDKLKIEVNIDGSAYRNPGHEGGLAVYARYSDGRPPKLIFKEGYDGTTNNRMELKAAIRAIEHARDIAKKEPLEGVYIKSDSKYLVENYNRVARWRAQGWESSEGRILENTDLWKRILSLRSWSHVKISLEWEEGKTTPEGKHVDKEAKKAAKGTLKRVDLGYIKPRVGRSKLGGKIATTMYPADGHAQIIRIYEYETLKSKHKEEYRVKFDLYSEAEKKFTEKYFAYIPKVGPKQFHCQHCYVVKFNDNDKHPVIERVEEIKDPTKP